MAGADVPSYDEHNRSQDDCLHSARRGAGIRVMLEPLLAIDRPRKGRLLDVGCGFGYVPHFWRECGYGEAVGLEGRYPDQAAFEKLGVTIFPSDYSQATELHDEQFDYVFSSDVIEYVEDPEAFVAEISGALSEDGILVLSTPSATALTEESPHIVLLSTLSPGFRSFIVSPDGLEDLLRRCGFEHVMVRDTGTRLFAWASHVPLPKIRDQFVDGPVYLEYLENLSSIDDPHIACGALYRGLKNSIDLDQLDKLADLYSRFQALTLNQYGIDFEGIELSHERQRQEPGNGGCPSWMGRGMLYAGLAQKHLGTQVEKLVPLFAAAIETLQSELDLAEQFAGDSAYFMETAKKEHKLAQAALLAQNANVPDPAHKYVLRFPKALKGENVCLMAVFAPQGKVSAATGSYINLLSEQGLSVVACLATEDSTADVDVTNLSNAAGIIVRQNGGMDFSAWAGALNLLPECWEAERLVFTNDSIIALPDIFPEFINRSFQSDADYVAATDSFQISYHTQSYFFILQGAALSHPDVIAFWTKLQMLTEKQDVIESYEVKFLNYISKKFDLSHQILFPLEEMFIDIDPDDQQRINVTHDYWEYLIASGFPFVKVELVRDNPLKVNILNWKSVLTRHGVDVEAIVAHMAPRKKQTQELFRTSLRAEWRQILRELNKVRLNAHRRRKKRRQLSN